MNPLLAKVFRLKVSIEQKQGSNRLEENEGFSGLGLRSSSCELDLMTSC